MTNNTKEIVEDICRLEPSLRSKEKELRGLVEKLLAAKPEAQADPAFLSKLKQEAIAAFQNQPQRGSAVRGLLRSLNSVSRPVYALAGAALALVVAIPLMSPSGTPVTGPYLTELPDSLAKLAGGSANQEKIVTVADAAFGALSSQSPGVYASESAPADSPAVGYGGGGGRTVSGLEAAPISVVLPPYERYAQVFSYGGELPSVSPTVDVLRFITDADDGLAEAARGLGLVDISQLSQKQAVDFSMVEDKEYGYGLRIDYQRGQINIYQNYERWPSPYDCDNKRLCQPTPMQFSDIPDDSVITAATDSFLRRFGVSLDDYGQPEVDRSWARQARNPDGPNDYWVPDTLNVVYPLVVRGKTVYNEGGRPFGIDVSYSLRYQRVVNAGPLMLRSFQSSAYQAQTDTSKLQEAISRGGANNWLDQEAGKRIEYALGAPEDVYVTTYRYDQQQPEMLLVPGWAFEIDRTGVDEGNRPYWSDHIVIPLAADFYRQPEPPVLIQPYGGMPEPMPAVEPALLESAAKAEE